jgi:hypothetical protein
MDGEQLIKDAAAAMGVGQPDDYKIAPTKHADSLEATAAALSKIARMISVVMRWISAVFKPPLQILVEFVV